MLDETEETETIQYNTRHKVHMAHAARQKNPKTMGELFQYLGINDCQNSVRQSS